MLDKLRAKEAEEESISKPVIISKYKKRKIINEVDEDNKNINQDILLPRHHGINEQAVFNFLKSPRNIEVNNIILNMKSIVYINTELFLVGLNHIVDLFVKTNNNDLTKFCMISDLEYDKNKSSGWVLNMVYTLLKSKDIRMPHILSYEEFKDIGYNYKVIICDDMLYTGTQLERYLNNYIYDYTSVDNVEILVPFVRNGSKVIPMYIYMYFNIDQNVYFDHRVADSTSIRNDIFYSPITKETFIEGSNYYGSGVNNVVLPRIYDRRVKLSEFDYFRLKPAEFVNKVYSFSENNIIKNKREFEAVINKYGGI